MGHLVALRGAPLTEVKFHFNVADRTEYACRLLRKASRQGATVVVTGPVPVLASLDLALWTFDALEFLPHVMLRAGQTVPERLRRTKVWLSEDPAASGHSEVLVNLGLDALEAPRGFESFARVIEVVSSDENDRAAARQRWKHYATRGYVIERHEVQQ
jgi:DNA polymerase-3 subunit chi